MNETRAQAQTAHASAVVNDASAVVRMGELADAARRVTLQLTGVGGLTVGDVKPGDLTGPERMLVLSASRTQLGSEARVVPTGPSAEALIAEGRAVVAEFRELLATQQRQNPRWFETPTAAIAVAALSLLVALLAFVGDRVDAAGEHPAAPPPAGAPPVAPELGGQANRSAPGR